MKEIDLHKVRHEDADGIVIDACMKYGTPFVIITGNSSKMKKIVEMAVKKMGLGLRDSFGNPGRVIVRES